MRVLWVCNIMLPFIAEHLNEEQSVKEGWIEGLVQQVLYGENSENLELGICFPIHVLNQEYQEELIVQKDGKEKKISIYGYYEDLLHPEKYDFRLEERFSNVFFDFKPDVIHCFGTEYGHTLAALRASTDRRKVLIGIQGVCDELEKVYEKGIPQKICRRFTLRDVLKWDNIRLQKKKFAMRGKIEREVIREVVHVTGRTRFDREWAERMNPKIQYHLMNETLRFEFYEGQWNKEKCIPYSIFLSQGDYPIKGLHCMIEALPEILKEYPKTHVYVAGQSIIKHGTLKEKLKISSYGKYLLELIKRMGVEDKITFLGKLNAKQMKERYLSSQLFVCPSILENSPNSLGEAMILGMPCVAARVGGIPSLFSGQEGILFEGGNVKELANAVKEMWKNPLAQEQCSKAARKRALCNHDAEKNYHTLLGIYQEICNWKES